jgi:phosphoenolpyruvate carboxylase
MPRAAQNGRIRITEQGEVISFRYALPGIAHRHSEQLVSAVLVEAVEAGAAGFGDIGDLGDLGDLGARGLASPSPEAAGLMDRIAEASMAAYRGLIDDPAFWDWYVAATPIEQISRLPIASRPVSRGAASEVDFDGLRAIPWVFAWTQIRAIVPGWYGVGAGLDGAAPDPAAAGDAGDRLRRLYEDWPFFRAVVDNAQREMARARLEVACRYAELAEPEPGSDAGEPPGEDGFFGRVDADFEAARRAILAITGQSVLLEGSPVIRKSIGLRNPYTDVLNLVQVELLRRYRAADPDGRDRLRELLFLSINGLAAAMQSTG